MEEPTPLTVPEIARLLRSSTAAIDTEVQAAPPRAVRWHPAPGEWCVNEVLGHLIEADRRGFAGRVEVLLESDHQELLGWDQEVVAGGRRDCERDAAELLEELLGHRERGLRMLDGLTAAEMARSGRHPKVGELSVGDVVNEWIHHDRNHLKQILSNLQAYVWPQMGAAQRFSGE